MLVDSICIFTKRQVIKRDLSYPEGGGIIDSRKLQDDLFRETKVDQLDELSFLTWKFSLRCYLKVGVGKQFPSKEYPEICLKGLNHLVPDAASSS